MRRKMLLALTFACAISACSSSPRRGEDVIESAQIRASSADAQRRYDAALAQLEAGQWATAEEEFRLIQADFPDDPIAQVAELYAARAALRDFRSGGEGPTRALPLLSGLARSEAIDTRIRYAALVYMAAAHAASGHNDLAMSALETYPGASLSPNILKRDRIDAWTLVVEGLASAKRTDEAVVALAEAFEDAPSNTALSRYAVARVFDLVPSVKEGVLSEWATDDDVFLRAAGGYGLVALHNVRDDDTLNAAIDALNTIGATNRATELATLRPIEHYDGPLRIGVLAPLTGPNKAIGERAVRGAGLATLTTPHGQVTLVIEDSEDPQSFDRLQSAGVLAVVGPVDAAHTREIASRAADVRLPVMALSTEIPASTDAWVFQDFVDATYEAKAVASIASKNLGARRYAILAPDIGYGSRMASAFREAILVGGGDVVVDETYDRRATDYTKLANKVASQHVDAIFIPDTATKVAEITAFLAAKNIWGRAPGSPLTKDGRTHVYYLGTSLWQDPSLLRQAASYVFGATIPAWFSPAFDSRPSKEFYATWASQGFTATPTELEVFSYDAVSHLVAELARTRTVSRTAIRQGLVDSVDTVGISPARWELNGKAKRSLGFITVKGVFIASPLVYSPEQVDQALPSQ